jgi:hypothetical protein
MANGLKRALFVVIALVVCLATIGYVSGSREISAGTVELISRVKTLTDAVEAQNLALVKLQRETDNISMNTAEQDLSFATELVRIKKVSAQQAEEIKILRAKLATVTGPEFIPAPIAK